jgi:glycosyltransferase involved in cell wall biosynthesis/tetratricopeptide (TPR) repeat protein
MTRLACPRSPRIALITDASSPDLIPAIVREVADAVVLGDLSCVGRAKVPENADGALVWCKGEEPISGAAADWRRSFFSKPVCSAWVAVHWPCLEHADLLGLEPRVMLAGAQCTIWNPFLRIAGSKPSEKRKTAWRTNGRPWAQLSVALWQENERPGDSLDSLRDLWQSKAVNLQFSALVLRNLILVLMRRGDVAKAEELLNLGEQAFPGYAELAYLHGVSFTLQRNPSRAIKFLEAALSSRGREFVGSGGENSYRAKFLLGAICDQVSQKEKAIQYWAPCLQEQPAFRPAVQALLQQEMPRAKAQSLHYPLAEMVRREPYYLDPVVNFMLAHKMVLPARRLIETMAIDTAQRERHLEAITQAEARIAPQPRTATTKPGVAFMGPFFDASGHARINRAVGLALVNSPQFDTSFDSTTWPTLSPPTLGDGEKIWNASRRQTARLDLTIRHQWPPNFDRVSSGKLVCILPWEHKAVPVRWVEEIEAKVDEVWTPSQFVREAFLRGGASPQRIRMLPNAVDPKTFRPDGPATRPPYARGFIFLFVGGLIRRKGIDLLLQAYGDAFTPEEDVTLVVKDLGSRTFYNNITRLADVHQFATRSSAPHTLILMDEMDDAALAALYRGVDALVLPYRGEGFGLPMIEAMACGKPIIATGEGPAVEFCSVETGYLLPAREVPVPEAPPPVGKFSGEWTWFEPDVAALARTMRYVYEHREEAAGRGQKAANTIRDTLTWERVLPMYLERVAHLVASDAPHP